MIPVLILAGLGGLLLLSVALAALSVSRAKRHAAKWHSCYSQCPCKENQEFRARHGFKPLIRHAPDNLHYRPFISTEESN
jgi:hypothetical protein